MRVLLLRMMAYWKKVITEEEDLAGQSFDLVYLTH